MVCFASPVEMDQPMNGVPSGDFYLRQPGGVRLLCMGLGRTIVLLENLRCCIQNCTCQNLIMHLLFNLS